MPEGHEGPDAAVHRALASASRLRILDLLRDAEGGLSAQTVSEQVGLHLSTVREHLETLAAARLVTKAPEKAASRGRPRLLYAAAPESGAPEVDYKMLAKLFAQHLHELGAVPEEAGEEAGRRMGAALAETEQSAPAQGSREDALRRVVRLLADLGFAPELVVEEPGARILLHRCPFADLARSHTDVVCGVHLGLIRGAMGELGVPDVQTSLTPFVEPEYCLVEIGSPAEPDVAAGH